MAASAIGSFNYRSQEQDGFWSEEKHILLQTNQIPQNTPVDAESPCCCKMMALNRLPQLLQSFWVLKYGI